MSSASDLHFGLSEVGELRFEDLLDVHSRLERRLPAEAPGLGSAPLRARLDLRDADTYVGQFGFLSARVRKLETRVGANGGALRPLHVDMILNRLQSWNAYHLCLWSETCRFENTRPRAKDTFRSELVALDDNDPVVQALVHESFLARAFWEPRRNLYRGDVRRDKLLELVHDLRRRGSLGPLRGVQFGWRDESLQEANPKTTEMRAGLGPTATHDSSFSFSNHDRVLGDDPRAAYATPEATAAGFSLRFEPRDLDLDLRAYGAGLLRKPQMVSSFSVRTSFALPDLPRPAHLQFGYRAGGLFFDLAAPDPGDGGLDVLARLSDMAGRTLCLRRYDEE